ncbi:hypothetical protein ACKAV7_001713 [Fusarium commune]|uniref:MFS transporter asaE n=1 Tax=Fusarium oxysporum f. sp. rapae TaxID=485398 RepID=A0A8J5U5B6_FUSOX|nr:MFS transporter asaE [Fusarium oxysporum f. sp. rapae]KAI7759407.1 hypothetical protein LZL87_008784 [Fusarium oxysporum]
MSQTSIELRQDPGREEGFASSGLDLASTHENEVSSLPPVDGGKDAWLFLAASFMVEALTWGFPFAFGVFQDYYSTNAPFEGSSAIAVIGTCAMGIMYLGLPFTMSLQRLYPRQSRWSPMIGLFIMCIALALSSFSQNTTHLILTQGVLYAIGGSISYCPCILYMDEWFAKPLGFFLPGIYLPSYARTALGAGSFASALTVLLINVASVFGCVAMGALTDRLHVTDCFMISAAGTTLSTFLLWGFSTNLPILYVFCIFYGIFAGSYTSAWTGIMQMVSSTPSNTRTSGTSFDPAMVLGVLSAGRGIGNIASGPLSGALIKGMPWQGQAAGGYGTGYGTLIVFTGATALASGATFIFRRVGWM